MLRKFVANARAWARNIKRDVHTVWLAAREPRNPRCVKGLAMLVAAYAVSPGDLIPDFIPVIGLPDDLIPVPLRIMMVVHLVPEKVMRGHRETVAQVTRHPISRITAGILILLWGLCATLLVRARLSCDPACTPSLSLTARAATPYSPTSVICFFSVSAL
ncbi:YkvA family protein [Pantoea deleyi]|uniref:YkvA family protein n=1 Tax=Pantoea deleyi TaxID=470932 RepID=UPI0035D40DE4